MEYLTFEADPANNNLFQNVIDARYWTSTPYRDFIDPCIYYPNYDVPCTLEPDNGDRTDFYWQWTFVGSPLIPEPYKTTLRKGNSRYAWPVRDGDVLGAVPVPAAVYLFGSGLLGLFAFIRRSHCAVAITRGVFG
jgi:hypothetical protein